MNRKSIMAAAGEEDPSKIYKVDLGNHNISQITLHKQFDKLRCLILSFNHIDRIENLQPFTDLRELHLENNNISKLGGVEGNKALSVLNLRNNSIEKIQNIGHLIKLQTLNLDHNRVKKISGLEYLKDLKNLYVSHNFIDSVTNLPAFSKLQNLNLSHNQIKTIPSNLFASSKGLVSLDLSNNSIENTNFLQNLGSLESLNLSHNKIKELQVGPMANLQSANVSNNQIEVLPPFKTAFPELVSINVSHNMICSQLQVLSALAEVEYLAEFDCRQNPMNTQSFELGIQKIHNFDFLNGKSYTKAGAKYYDKINDIQLDLTSNKEIYDEDDEADRKLKMSGFYDDELEFRMTGMKVNRPSSPVKKIKGDDKEMLYDKIDRDYKQFMDNDRKIKVLRQHYKKICGQYNIVGSQHILTELPAQTTEGLMKKAEKKDTVKEDDSQKQILSQNYIACENQIKKENEKNLTKWKQLKQREKSFNIRDVIKKSRGRDSSMNNGVNSHTSSNWEASNGFKTGKLKSQLLRTQVVPKKAGDDLIKTIARPRSMRKKD